MIKHLVEVRLDRCSVTPFIVQEWYGGTIVKWESYRNRAEAFNVGESWAATYGATFQDHASYDCD